MNGISLLVVVFFIAHAIKFVFKCFAFLDKLIGTAPRRVNRTRRRFPSPDVEQRRSNMRLEEWLDRRKATKPFDIYRLCKKLGGELEFRKNQSEITFRRKDISYRAIVNVKRKLCSVRVLADWPDVSFRLRVFPDKQHGVRRNYKGFEDFKIGQREFDRRFVIQGTSQKRLAMILNESVCRRIRQHRKYANDRISIKIAFGAVELGSTSNRFMDTTQVLGIVTNLAEIHRQMLLANEGELQAEFNVVQSDKTICMVCGEAILDSFVTCDVCQIPCHRDCWDYIGSCSTYGCRSRKCS